MFSPDEPERYRELVDELTDNDHFLVTADFDAFAAMQREVAARWHDQRAWWRSSVLNTANVGWFSSDRAIREYAEDIWNVAPRTLIGIAPLRTSRQHHGDAGGMAMDLIVRNAGLAHAPDAPPVDIGVAADRIVAIETALQADGPVFDAGGGLVCGGLIETHIHLDKSNIIDRCAPEAGRQADAMQRVAAVKQTFTVEDVYERAGRTLNSKASESVMPFGTYPFSGSSAGSDQSDARDDAAFGQLRNHVGAIADEPDGNIFFLANRILQNAQCLVERGDHEIAIADLQALLNPLWINVDAQKRCPRHGRGEWLGSAHASMPPLTISLPARSPEPVRCRRTAPWCPRRTSRPWSTPGPARTRPSRPGR